MVTLPSNVCNITVAVCNNTFSPNARVTFAELELSVVEEESELELEAELLGPVLFEEFPGCDVNFLGHIDIDVFPQ